LDYQRFIESKQIEHPSTGLDISRDTLSPYLFPFQADLTWWAARKGRAALFTATGTGKTRMQLEYSRQVHDATGGKVLILAPLAVNMQTVREAEKMDIAVHPCRTKDDVKPGINITNYDMLHHFNPRSFEGVVIDESSCLKAYNGKFRQYVTDSFKDVPFRLSCTATPAPNDYMELGTQSEFLGVMSRNEMLSMFFTHDGGSTSQWRLKGHAQNKFWEWLASWAAVVTRPSDLGYEDNGFILPHLNIHEEAVHVNRTNGGLFTLEARTLHEQREAARMTLPDRVKRCAEIVNDTRGPFLVWCNLNAESEALKKAIPDAIEVKGSDNKEHKEKAMLGFSDGTYRVLVSKPSICGWGMNWQHCSNMAFVGLSHSFEQWYQAIRRCWRFGQTKPVNVYAITSNIEGAIKANLERKERESEAMIQEMVKFTQDITRRNVRQTVRETSEYNPKMKMQIPDWLRSETV
jgi:hypothetical protein